MDDTQYEGAAAQQWPELPASAIAIIAGSSQSYVSEVLQGGKTHRIDLISADYLQK